MVSMMLMEVWALWCVTAKKFGGLGWESSTVGSTIALCSLSTFACQFVIYPRITRFGVLPIFKIASLLLVPFVCATPFASTIIDSVGNNVVWVVVVLNKIIVDVLSAFAFNSIFVVINNSVPTALLGTTNGIGMTVASVGKGIGPGFGGAIFAWSLSDQVQVYPLTYHASFVLAGALFVTQFTIATKLPLALEEPYSVHPS